MYERIVVATDRVPTAPAATIPSALGASAGSLAPITVTHSRDFDDVDRADLERIGLDTGRRSCPPHARRPTSASEGAIHPPYPNSLVVCIDGMAAAVPSADQIPVAVAATLRRGRAADGTRRWRASNLPAPMAERSAGSCAPHGDASSAPSPGASCHI